MWYADKSKDKQEPLESVGKALSQIKKKLWKTPHGFKGITSASIRKKDEEQEQIKQDLIANDAKATRIIKNAIKTGNHKTVAERLKELYSADSGTMQKEVI